MHLPLFVAGQFDGDGQVWRGQTTSRLGRPLGQLQAHAGKNISKARILPLLWVIETVKVKVPNCQIAHLVRFHHGIGRAFDAATHPQGAQQMPHESGFARAQIALQLNEAIADGSLARQGLGTGLGVVLAVPDAAGAVSSYNRRVTAARTQIDPSVLWPQVQTWARELGFSQIGVTGVDLASAEPGFKAWLEAGFHGSMHYMAAHGSKRARPAELVPGTVSVLSARMDYLPRHTQGDWVHQETARASRPDEAVVSVYARGRDYHKILRQRLQQLQSRMAQAIGPFGHRVFTDSAPVLEAELATRSGLGWRGKNTLVLQREAGSMFFLGELFVDLALPHSAPVSAHCGQCSACIDLCPTAAIVGPQQLDARRCISYLTIEHDGPIPIELRPLIGNRIYGCDECQLVCPWNKYAQRSSLPDFDARPGLADESIAALLAWDEAEFLRRTEGSAIRRIGHARWLRNLALAAGNALASDHITVCEASRLQSGLQGLLQHPSEVVREQAAWSLALTR